MKKDKIVYSLDVSDILEIADQDLERVLTKEELKKVIELVPKYINWAESISFVIEQLELPTNKELTNTKKKI